MFTMSYQNSCWKWWLFEVELNKLTSNLIDFKITWNRWNLYDKNRKLDFCSFVGVAHSFFSRKEKELDFGSNISYHVIAVSITSFFSSSREKDAPSQIWRHNTIHSIRENITVLYLSKNLLWLHIFIFIYKYKILSFRNQYIKKHVIQLVKI